MSSAPDKLSEIGERLERAQAALAHTDVFKAEQLVHDAVWLHYEVMCLRAALSTCSCEATEEQP